MGDDAAASLSGGGAAANALLGVDSHFGVLMPAAGHALPARRLDCIPTIEQLMEALRANGYSPQPGGSGGGGGGRQRARQQGGAAAAAAGGQQQGQEDEGQEEPHKMQRIQCVKLILRTAAAVCRYCAKASWGRAGSQPGVWVGNPASCCNARCHAACFVAACLWQHPAAAVRLQPPLQPLRTVLSRRSLPLPHVSSSPAHPSAAPGSGGRRAEPRGPVRLAAGGAAPGPGPSRQPAARGNHRG